MLVNFLMQDWKLLPLCVTCVSTVKAIKLLSVSEKTPLFSFAAIFDPPHLLKCVCNLFLKHNVANVECEITVNGERLTGTA
jgi:hypothetical protein